MKSLFQHTWLTAGAVFLSVGVLALGASLSAKVLRGPTAVATRSTKAIHAAELTFLRPGDLVFRRGQSVLSAAVMALDSGSLYSHVGIVARTAEGLSVVHSVADEAPDRAGSVRADGIPENENTKLIKEQNDWKIDADK